MKRRMLPAISVKNDSSEVRCECSSQLMLIGHHSAHEDLASVTEASRVKTPAFVARGVGWRLGELHQTAFLLTCPCRDVKARDERGEVPFPESE